jgi:CheY-like chemotaxis protein
LESLDREQPSFVLTDQMKPRQDGWELCRRLRARAETSRLPSVGMSAVDPRGADFDAFLRKPFELDELLSILDRLSRLPTRSA